MDLVQSNSHRRQDLPQSSEKDRHGTARHAQKLQVRGKRMRHGERCRSSPGTNRGRPFKPREQLATVRRAAIKQHTLQMQSQSHRPVAQQLSNLEALPTELIQTIFFYALEANLPRASTRLSQVLSSNSIYKALILFAYFDDDGEQPVETHHFLPAEYRVISVDEKIALQSAILPCRWCTYDLIDSQLETLRRLVSCQAWHRWRAMQGQSFQQAAGRSVLVSDTKTSLRLPDLQDQRAVAAFFYRNDVSCIRDLTGRGGPGGSVPARQPYWTILAARVMPSHLFRENWTKESLTTVQLLYRGYSHLTYGRSMFLPASAVFEGMAIAIRQQHVEALETLSLMHKHLLQGNSSHDHQDTCGCNCSNHHHIVPLELFHLAARQQTAGLLLRLLINTAVHDVPIDDDILTTWALRESVNGNGNGNNASVATWLLDWMRGTSDTRTRQQPLD